VGGSSLSLKQTLFLCALFNDGKISIFVIQGLEIRNGGGGIYIVFDSRGRPTGEAFVQFCNSEDTDLAMKKNREKIGQR
jgi:RNA recognition motif-containing protein